MLFSEVYGTYYQVLGKLLAQAQQGGLTREQLLQTVQESGFEESILTIPQALEQQSWPLLHPDGTTPLRHPPSMPLTLLQKRWLKTLLQDKRIRLFAPDETGLEEVQPLYPPDAVVYYDRYADGDPFDDPDYIRHFRCILSAIRHKRWLRIRFTGSRGLSHQWKCIPYRLEYSSKDDKFRLISADRHQSLSINLARITHCIMLEPWTQEEYCPKPMKKRILVLELRDERNALERAMLHFSHLEKQTERMEDGRYRLTLFYQQEDETELLIRVLSFGPVLKAVFPEDFVKKLQERLEKQKRTRTQT